MLAEVLAGLVAALGDALAVPRVVGAGFFDETGFAGQVHDLADGGDTGAIGDLELTLAERWRDLVLDYFHTRLVAHRLLAVFHHAGLADVEANAGVELERVAASGGLGVAVDHTDLLAKLVAAPNVDKRVSRSRSG